MHTNRLSEDRCCRRHNRVLLTGNGQPLRRVRRLARYILSSADPDRYGLSRNVRLKTYLPRKLREEDWLD